MLIAHEPFLQPPFHSGVITKVICSLLSHLPQLSHEQHFLLNAAAAEEDSFLPSFLSSLREKGRERRAMMCVRLPNTMRVLSFTPPPLSLSALLCRCKNKPNLLCTHHPAILSLSLSLSLSHSLSLSPFLSLSLSSSRHQS